MNLKLCRWICTILLTFQGLQIGSASEQAESATGETPDFPPPVTSRLVAVPGLQPPVDNSTTPVVEDSNITCDGGCFEDCFCEHVPWLAYGEFQAAPGDNETLIDGTAFVPLWQDQATLLFANIRGQADDVEQYEGNWGLGLRSIQENCWILGAHASYDRRWTNNSNEFNQATFGVEALAIGWEARANGYIPENDTKTFGPRRPLVPGVAQQQFEVAYYGFDTEVGALLNSWGCDNEIELRGFVGGFHFDNDRRLPNISGPRARLELRLYDLDLLGEQSRITLGAHYQWDQVRDDQVHVLLRVRIPLGPKTNTGRLGRLERRMVDRIVRDVDIVVNDGMQPVGTPLPPPPPPPPPPAPPEEEEETVPE